MIGNGVVIHPPALLKEIETLAGQGVEIGGRLHVSDRAHVILPYHLAEERLTEESASAADHLGTTRRGIGPCYRDKVGRVHGVRVGDLYHPDRFREHLDRIVAYKNRLLTAMLPDFEPFDAGAVADEYLGYAERLRPFVRDTTTWLHEALAAGQAAAVRRGAGVAAGRRPRQLSVRDQLEQQRRGDRGGLGGADAAHRPLDRRSSRRTRRGSAAGRSRPSRTTTIGERIRRVGTRVRHRHRPPPAVRLVRRGGRPLLGPGQRLDRDRA